MTPAQGRRSTTIMALLSVALALAACTSAASSAPPTGSPSTASTPSLGATLGPTATATATAVPTAESTPLASSSGAPCALPQTESLPSARVTDLQILGLPGRDIVSFEFGPGSSTPAGPPVGTLTVAGPPFSQAASGRWMELDGKHALQLVFRGMLLANEAGQPTFTGQREIRVPSSSRSLRHVIMFDESEGQIGWYIGYDRATCVTLSREGDRILVAIDFA